MRQRRDRVPVMSSERLGYEGRDSTEFGRKKISVLEPGEMNSSISKDAGTISQVSVNLTEKIIGKSRVYS